MKRLEPAAVGFFAGFVICLTLIVFWHVVTDMFVAVCGAVL